MGKKNDIKKKTDRNVGCIVSVFPLFRVEKKGETKILPGWKVRVVVGANVTNYCCHSTVIYTLDDLIDLASQYVSKMS